MPREGEWERTYRVLQAQARHALAVSLSSIPSRDRPERPAPVRD
jgi:hypothetical protein